MVPRAVYDRVRLSAVAGVAVVGASLVLAALCLLCVDTVLPRSPLLLSEATRHAIYRFAPQGWKFFTKDPHSTEFFVYRAQSRAPSGESWESITAPPMASRENLWGADRVIRTQGLEIALLLDAAGDELRWTECDDDIERCAVDAAPGPAVRNRAPVPTICGTIAMTKERPVPWAWRHLRSRMPMTIARARVECSNG